MAKTITSNGCDSPFLNTTSLPLMLVSAGKTWVRFFIIEAILYILLLNLGSGQQWKRSLGGTIKRIIIKKGKTKTPGF